MVSMKKLIVLFLIPILLCCETGAEEVFNKTLNLELLKEYEKSETLETEKKKQNRYDESTYLDKYGDIQFFKCDMVFNNYDNLSRIDQARYNSYCKSTFNEIWGEHNPASWDSPYKKSESKKKKSDYTCRGMLCEEPIKRNYNDCMQDREKICGDMRLDPEKVGEQYKKNVEKRCMDYQKDFCSRFK